MPPGCLCVSTQLLVSDGFLKGAGLVLELNHSVATVRMFFVPVPMIYERLEMHHHHLTGFGLTPSKTHLILFCECFGWSDWNFSRVYTWTWEDMSLGNLNQSRIVANESQHNIAEIRGVLACSGCHVDKT